MGRSVEYAAGVSSHPRGAVQQGGFDGSLSEFSGLSRRSTSKGRFRKPPTFTTQDRVTLTSLVPADLDEPSYVSSWPGVPVPGRARKLPVTTGVYQETPPGQHVDG
jgi:hypothetical protein